MTFREGAALLDRSERTKIQFKGEQAFWFLDQLLTNKLDEIPAGEGAETLLLTPKGRITSVMRVISSGSTAHTDAPAGHAEMLIDFFGGRIFATKVEIADRTADFGIISLLGPRSDEIARAALARFVEAEPSERTDLGLELPPESQNSATHFGTTVLVRVTRPVRGLDLFVVRERTAELVDAFESAGAGTVSDQDYSALCAIEGTAQFGIDFDEGYLPQEAALERAVHFDKGCYLGQEAVAMAQRGRVKRRLRHVEFSAPAAPGDVLHEEAKVGQLTSVGSDASTTRGIATLSTKVPIGSVVRVGGVDGVVAELPGTTEGPKGPSARELREKLEQGRA